MSHRFTSTPQTAFSRPLSSFVTPTQTEELSEANKYLEGHGAPHKNREARPEAPVTYFRERLAFQSPPTRFDVSSAFSSPGLDISTATDNRCAICLGEIQKPARINGCLHEYHFHCIMVWSQTQSTCPICRSNFSKIYECASKVDAPNGSIFVGDPIEWSITSAPSGSASANSSFLSNSFNHDSHGVPQLNWSSDISMIQADED